MSFYIRKSLRFGPIRFNLSKSGAGISAGIKGFRLGSGPRGNYVHMGAHGIYYRSSLASSKLPSVSQNRSPAPPHVTPKQPPTSDDDVLMLDIDSKDAGCIVDSSSEELVREVNTKRQKYRFAPAVAWVSIGAVFIALLGKQPHLAVLLIALGLIAYITLRIWDSNRKTTVIFYELSGDAEMAFRQAYQSFESLASAKKIWHIPSRGAVRDRKYHSGANELVTRKEVSIRFKNPPCVKTNVPTPFLPVGAQTLYFFPDRIMIFDSGNVGSVTYSSLAFEITKTRFIETEGVPGDSRVIDRTWKYVNKSGGPDRRFKDNHEIPIAEYESVHMQTHSGMNELIYISSVGAFSRVEQSLQALSNFLRQGDRQV